MAITKIQSLNFHFVSVKNVNKEISLLSQSKENLMKEIN